jgi:hypothetical protein
VVKNKCERSGPNRYNLVLRVTRMYLFDEESHEVLRLVRGGDEASQLIQSAAQRIVNVSTMSVKKR